MIIRNEMTIVVTLLALSLVVGLIGVLASHPATTYTGILASFATAPAAVCTFIRRTQRATTDDLARAEYDGYLLGLQHAARGLLDPDPSDGVPANDPTEALRAQLRKEAARRRATTTAWGGYADQSHRNVIELYPIHERQVQ